MTDQQATPSGSPDDESLEERLRASLEAIEKAAGGAELRFARLPRLLLAGFSPVPDDFVGIEAVALTFLREAISSTSSCQSKILERLRQRRSSLALSSDINSEVVGVCKQILTFGAAGLALSLGFADKIQALHPTLQKCIVIAGIGYLELVFVSLFVLLWYLLQARFRYPFLWLTKIGNAWPYFYYASISPQVSRSPLLFRRGVLRANKLYAQDLLTFSARAMAETSKEEIALELRQYFLLLSYQGYVHQFSIQLTNLLSYGFVGSVVTVVVLLVRTLVWQ